MRNPYRYFKNLIRFSVLRIIYGNKIRTGLIQTFDKVKLDLKGQSKLIIGNFNQNRGKMYIGVNGGYLSIGNHCFFNINCSITCMNKIKIGDNCKFGNNLVIVDHDHNFRDNSSEFVTSSIIIGKNVWVGANVTILRGSQIGDNTIIGAGTTVKGKIGENKIYLNKNDTLIKDIDYRKG